MTDLAGMGAVHFVPGHHGRAGEPGVILKVTPPRALVSVIARRGSIDALSVAVKVAFDVDLPAKPRLARGRGMSFLWCGYHHWFAEADDASELLPRLRTEISPLAALSDQSDSRFIITLSGPAARATLAKLALVDLHPRTFDVGETAVTLFGHIGGQVTLTDDRPTYELMISRSFADDFLHSMLDAAAEFGIEVC